MTARRHYHGQAVTPAGLHIRWASPSGSTFTHSLAGLSLAGLCGRVSVRAVVVPTPHAGARRHGLPRTA